MRVSLGKAFYVVAAVLAFCHAWYPLHAAPAKQRSWRDTTWDDPHVADITDVDTYLRRKFRQDVTDPATGVGADALKKVLSDIVASGRASRESWWVTKAKCFAAQVKEQSIDVSPFDWFPAIAVWDRWSRPIKGVVKNRAKEVNAENLPVPVREEYVKFGKRATLDAIKVFRPEEVQPDEHHRVVCRLRRAIAQSLKAGNLLF